MGRIGIVDAVENDTTDGEDIPTVQLDPGGGDSIATSLFSAPGDDSKPLPGDLVATSSHPGGEGQVCVGFADTDSESKSLGGEVRRYARNANRVTVSEFYMTGDGTITLSNDNGSIELAADGTVAVNGGGAATVTNGAGTIEILATGQISLNGALTVDP